MEWVWVDSWFFAAMSGRPLMKFESGYTVETVFDGSKLGIEPFAVEILPNGDTLVLDSENSNIYEILPPLSPCESCASFSFMYIVVFCLKKFAALFCCYFTKWLT